MILDIGEESFHQAHVFDSLKDDSLTEWYFDCSSFSHLSTALRLFNMKARNGWNDINFTELLEFLHEILAQGNTSSTSHNRPRRYSVQWVWSTKKYMLVQMIVYCIEKFKGLHKCPRCGVSIYK